MCKLTIPKLRELSDADIYRVQLKDVIEEAVRKRDPIVTTLILESYRVGLYKNQ